MNQWRRRLYLIGMGLGICLFGYQLWNGFQAISHDAASIVNVQAGLAGWMLVVLAIGLQMLIWKYVMQKLQMRLAWRKVVRGYPISFLPRYIPGSIWGYMTRGQWFFENCNVPFVHSATGSLIEVSVSVVAVLLVISWKYIQNLGFGIQLAIVLGMIVVFGGVWRVWRRGLARSGLSKRFGPMNRMIGLISNIRTRSLLVAIGSYVVLWLCYGGLTLSVLNLFGLVKEVDLYTATFIYSLAWLIGFLIIFIPAGIGIREVLFSALLSTYAGLSYQQSSAVSVTSRLIVLVGEASWVIVGLILRSRQKSRYIDPIDSDSPN